ncbi:Hypothetical predicted protein [Podarcis lilfordi]|uniref:Uncharacterized protein n=1 Tax=Podarcis lilfordi TaxID=74358 RepID=A0AA35KEU3_9SAUR|nr:Hypothetical predicted protein [Podarcis lilfordi]
MAPRRLLVLLSSLLHFLGVSPNVSQGKETIGRRQREVLAATCPLGDGGSNNDEGSTPGNGNRRFLTWKGCLEGAVQILQVLPLAFSREGPEVGGFSFWGGKTPSAASSGFSRSGAPLRGEPEGLEIKF